MYVCHVWCVSVVDVVCCELVVDVFCFLQEAWLLLMCCGGGGFYACVLCVVSGVGVMCYKCGLQCVVSWLCCVCV